MLQYFCIDYKEFGQDFRGHLIKATYTKLIQESAFWALIEILCGEYSLSYEDCRSV